MWNNLLAGAPIKLDLGIILGATKQISEKTFEVGKDISKSIVERYRISEEETLIGAIVYGADAKVAFRFADVTDTKAILKRINGIQRGRLGNNVLKALEIARDELFEFENGARKGAAKSVIVFVDSDQDTDPRLERVSLQLKEKGIKVIVIEIGPSDGKPIASSIADSEKDVVGASRSDNMNEVVDEIKDIAKPGIFIVLTLFSIHLVWKDSAIGDISVTFGSISLLRQ